MTDLSKIPLVILAGGKATRLGDLSKNLPKYLMPINSSETFADVHLRWAHQVGFRKVVLSIAYLAEQVRAYVKNGSKYGLEVQYIEDGPQPAGTGGALRPLKLQPPEVFCLTYGDTLLNFPVQKFITSFMESGKSAGITAFLNSVPGHSANIQLTGTDAFYDKKNPKPEMRHIDYGFLVFRRRFLSLVNPSGPAQDLAEPLNLLAQKKDLFGFEVTERFWEIGSPQALSEFQAKIRS